MCFPFVFVFRFLILMNTTIMHSKCMCLWDFDFSHVDKLVLLLCQRFNKDLKRGHLPGGSIGEPN
jgi:hypothetical protein